MEPVSLHSFGLTYVNVSLAQNIEKVELQLDEGRYDKAVLEVEDIFARVNTPLEVIGLLAQNNWEEPPFKKALGRIFQKSFNQFEILLPVFERFFEVIHFGENYIELKFKQSHQYPMDCKIYFQRNRENLSFEEGVQVLKSFFYEDQNDLVFDYLELAKFHVGKLDDCIQLAFEHIEKQEVPISPDDYDDLLDFFIEKGCSAPENGQEWLNRAASRLEQLRSEPFPYYYGGIAIAQYYYKRENREKFRQAIETLIYNLRDIEQGSSRNAFAQLLFHALHEFVNSVKGGVETITA